MKKALSLLVAFTFLQVQTWALSGGPVFTTNGNTDLTGVYAGVMVGKSSTGPLPAAVSSGASVGTFSITVPVSGAATGNVVLFQNNSVYTGTINASADAGKRTIAGVIQATGTSNFVIAAAQINVPTVTIIPGTPPTVVTSLNNIAAVTVPLSALGTLNAKVSKNSSTGGTNGNAGANGVSRNVTTTSSSSSSTSSSSTSTTGTTAPSLGDKADRLTGTATVDITFEDTRTVGLSTNVATETKYSISGIRQTNSVSSSTGTGGGTGGTGGGGGTIIFPFI